MRKFKQFRKFIRAISGAREEVLEFVPSERVRFEGLGWAILITSCLAVISMWFALTSTLGINGLFAVPVAILWGVVIMGINRWLLTSMPVNHRRKFAVAVPRLLLTLLIGALIAIPMVLLVFRSEINAQIAVTQQSQQSKQFHNEDYEFPEVAGPTSRQPQASYLAQQQASSRSLQTRLTALGDLSNGNAAVASTLPLLFLLFLVVASLPVAARLLQGSGAYEVALLGAKAAEQRDRKKFFTTRLAHGGAAISRPPPSGNAEDNEWVASPPTPPDEDEDSEFAMSSELWSATQSHVGRGDPGQGRLATVGGDYHATAGESGGEPSYSGGGGQRYLQARYPDSIAVGKTFGLRVNIVPAAVPGGAALKPFAVPRGGRDIRLEAVVPPGLRVLGDRLLTVHVPADGDSDPVMFELCADAPGVRSMSVAAWIDGSYLGELRVDITAEHDNPAGTYRNAVAEISTEPVEGAVSLVVRFDSRQNAYRFEFRDEDNPDEVTSNLAYEPGPLVEQLIASLEDLAKGRSGHQADQVRAYLMNSGAALWHELVPKGLREQFWERQDRIRQLTILAEKDAVPWELLYPMDPGHDEGFLVEQFPVTRAIFNRRPSRKLSLWPARFVLPTDSLPQARAEIDAIRLSLDPGQPLDKVISGPMPLNNLIANENFGLLHFACHNAYDPAIGSSIKFGEVPFRPTDLTGAVINKKLAHSAPTIFINACRSAGLTATYNRLDGWATKFLEAGAAAFIGSQWAVSDGAAREFAQEFYGQLQTGSSLGEAVKCARTAAASQPGDPTWLAYAVYGDPRATVAQARP